MARSIFYLLFCCYGYALCGQTTSATPDYIFVERWGVDLSTRLDTLSPLFCDSVGQNQHWYRLITDSSYHLNFFPRVYKGMLVFADSSGNVQNIVVKSYDYEYFNGNINRGSHCNDRELMLPCMAIQRYPDRTRITIRNVECVDLAGRKMNIAIPPFYLVKVR